MKISAEEILSAYKPSCMECGYISDDDVLLAMEEYANLKTKEYQDAILHLHGMSQHYLKFIEESEETDLSRIELKEDFADIIKQHLDKYKHLIPEIDHEK